MIRRVQQSLMAKMLIAFLAATMIPVTIGGYVVWNRARTALQESEFVKLNITWASKQHELVSWFHGTVDDLALLAQTLRVRGAFEDLAASGSDSEAYKNSLSGLQVILQTYLDLNPAEEGFEDFLLVDGKSGDVLYTQKRLSDFGGNVKTGSLKDTCVGKAWSNVVSARKPAIADFSFYPATQTACAAVAVPVVHHKTGQFLGVLVVRINANEMNEIFSIADHAAQTNEIYVVGSDSLMRSQSRFEKQSTVLKKQADSEPVRLSREGKTATMIAKDYRGEPNLTVAGLVGLNKQKDFTADFDWVLVSELDEQEAMAGVSALKSLFLLIAAAVSGAIGLVAFLIARSVSRPVVAMARVAVEVSRGDLTATVPAFTRTDEIGVLAESFRSMVENLRLQINRILEGVSILGSAASEISTAVTEVAASAAQTSSAVTETSTTVEQVRQAARLASERAKGVAQGAQESISVSESGKKATEESIDRISVIRTQMETIGETVVRLSEHSQAIENIIATVRDLADQSNLLAVNASIEAARAGDQGKGFAVVAHEIKTLADQSKEATKGVRGILDDTQKWVSAVVMATEQGSKAVQAGVEQSMAAQHAIDKLSQSVGQSAQSAKVIDSSIQQQFVGVAQVANAMVSIDNAVRQNMDGTAQLDASAKRLAELGFQLKRLVDDYRL